MPDQPSATPTPPSFPRKAHICHFYGTREELVEVVVPFFKEGLEKGEFCLWAAADPLPPNDALKELKKVVPDLNRFVDRGQIQIFSSKEYYTKPFNPQRVYKRYMDAILIAANRGFAGFRVNGNGGHAPSEYPQLMQYESIVDNGIKPFPVTAMCSYPAAKCTDAEMLALRKTHGSTLRKRGGSWEFVPAAGAF